VAGETYVVFGKSSGFTATVDLSTLDGTNGFRLDGIDVGDFSGKSVSSAGDVNGDGFDDLIIGAYLAAPGTVGESYVVFGKSSGFTAAVDLSTLNGTNGFRLDGIDVGDFSGDSVSSAGDVNGDGFDDLIIGATNAAPGGKPGAGESYIVFGGNFTGGMETQVGDATANTLTANQGVEAVDILVGGQGSDTLISDGGQDVLYGGEGADTLAIVSTAFQRVAGGNGTDTLRLDGSGLTLNLTTLADNTLTDIEVIDITGSGANTLTLDFQEVVNISSTSNTLTVRGNAGDAVFLGTGWFHAANQTIDSVTYQVFTQGAATVLVESPVTFNAVNDDPTLNAIGNVSIAEDASEQTVNLSGITAGGGESQPLRVTASSSNTDLIPNPAVTYTSANTTGSIVFTPVADQSGTATITVTVEDGGLDNNLSTAGDNATFSRTFDVTVDLLDDFGDAPAPYPTTLAEDGARHNDAGPRLGATRDEEADGLHSASADADGSDEDGVVDTGGFLVVGDTGASVTINVQNAPGGAKLDAWMDFNQDGDWDDPEEQILVSTSVVNGNNTLTFDVPGSAVSGTTYARLRLSTAGVLAVTGAAPDGEVEDYEVEIDTVSPSVVISPSGILTNDEQITFTFQFSEPVDSFTGSDITLTNATAGTFTAVDSDTFTLVVTPIKSGTVTAAMDSGVTQDAARNNNSAGSASILSLGPASLTLSSGSEYEVLIDGSELVVQIQGGAEQFRQVTASISVLNISGSNGDDIVTVLNSGGVVSTPIEFTGENGNDQFDASQASGAVMLDGGAGNDTLSGGAGNDTILAGSEDDLVSGGAGSNVLSGGQGTDTLLVSGNRTLRISASTASGAGQNSHSEFEQATLAGGPGNNRLDASAAAIPVTLLGAAGNDTLLSGSSADRLDGGDGIDMAEITGTNIVLTDASAPGPDGDTVVSIEGVLLTASARGSVINASGYTLGSVTIVGSSGNDTLTGGAGNDVIVAGAGRDSVSGGAGNDLIMGNSGRDTLSGGSGDDTIIGGRGRDSIEGGLDADVLLGGRGSDTIGGGDGDDRIRGGGGRDVLDGDDGPDTLVGGGGRDNLAGGLGVDNLNGVDRDDNFNDQIGRDTLIGGIRPAARPAPVVVEDNPESEEEPPLFESPPAYSEGTEEIDEAFGELLLPELLEL
jgi:Ca2+-binding RTX toxin-like protein